MRILLAVLPETTLDPANSFYVVCSRWPTYRRKLFCLTKVERLSPCVTSDRERNMSRMLSTCEKGGTEEVKKMRVYREKIIWLIDLVWERTCLPSVCLETLGKWPRASSSCQQLAYSQICFSSWLKRKETVLQPKARLFRTCNVCNYLSVRFTYSYIPSTHAEMEECISQNMSHLCLQVKNHHCLSKANLAAEFVVSWAGNTSALCLGLLG